MRCSRAFARRFRRPRSRCSRGRISPRRSRCSTSSGSSSTRELERGDRDGYANAVARLGVKAADFDVVLDRPDPTGWLASQHGTVVPRLAWKPEHDALASRFPLGDGRLPRRRARERRRRRGSTAIVKDWPAGVVARALRRPRRRALRAVRPRAGAAVRPRGARRPPRTDDAPRDARDREEPLPRARRARQRRADDGLLPRLRVSADRRVALVRSAAGRAQAGRRLAQPAAAARAARRRGRGRAADPGRRGAGARARGARNERPGSDGAPRGGARVRLPVRAADHAHGRDPDGLARSARPVRGLRLVARASAAAAAEPADRDGGVGRHRDRLAPLERRVRVLPGRGAERGGLSAGRLLRFLRAYARRGRGGVCGCAC